MFYDDHNPPHFHAEYSGNKAVFDFQGNIIKGNLSSKTATKARASNGSIFMKPSLKRIGYSQEKAEKLEKLIL